MPASDKNRNQKVSLHLDERVVSAGSFVRGVRAFVGLIEELSGQIDSGLKWGISVREGSNVVDVMHTGPAESDYLAENCLSFLEAGLGVIEDRPEFPQGFTKTAVRQAKWLAEVVQREGGHIKGPSRLIRLTSQTSANADVLLGSPYRAMGSVEGELLLISDVQGPKIGVRDALTGRVISCKFDADKLDELATKFHQRISVRGWMKYSRDGTVSRIDVEDFRVLRSRDDLPSADDVRGILRDH